MTSPPFPPDHPPGFALLRSRLNALPGWLRFHDPVGIVRTDRVDEVAAALREVEQAADRGWFGAGFVAYEAAPAFDPAFVVRPPSPGPLAWFGLYREATAAAPPPPPADFPALDWQPATPYADYAAAVARIKTYIAAGETYQVNYTIRLEAPCRTDPRDVFRSLLPAQPDGYAAYLDTGDLAVCSLSPELFFEWEDGRLRMRPMKGTVRRGVTNAQDDRRAEWLRTSEKNRAENVMIVDMVRNDLGRIARRGSVRVPDLFRIERYRTLFQMTSTVEAHSDAPFADLFGALFPCASITGAPKIRTMERIAELEAAPRGVYTGAIGFLAPGRRAQFNVAIRTLVVDRRRGRAVFGTGGGIVWDSDPSDEYRECATKSLVLREPPPALDLLETIRWDPATGFQLLSEHLARLLDSARYFDVPVDESAVLNALHASVAGGDGVPLRLRLLVGPDGRPRVEVSTLRDEGFQADPQRTRSECRVAFSPSPIDRRNRFLYHKTTRRETYDDARSRWPDADDVLLWNDRRELTESTWANLVVCRDARWLTPPVECGLLAGTFRRRLLARGRIEEEVLPIGGLRESDRLYLVNSVRGWIRAVRLDKQG